MKENFAHKLVHELHHSDAAFDPEREEVEIVETGVRGVRLFHLPKFGDARGDLSVGEFERNIPFRPKRYFVVYNVPSRETRGEHAHRRCHQFLVSIAGTCNVIVDDGSARREFTLDRPTLGIHIPPMIWGTQYNHSADAALLVFASDFYDPADYIRKYDDFLSLVMKK